MEKTLSTHSEQAAIEDSSAEVLGVAEPPWFDGLGEAYVTSLYPSAFCEANEGLYQIRRPKTDTDAASLLQFCCLSSVHPSEIEAWAHAAERIRIAENVKAELEENKRAVLSKYRDAFCVEFRRNTYQIRRELPRARSRANRTYLTLSGRFGVPEFAWQDAARRMQELE
jgi:hypothetical protein